jgi:hypothetical protein
MPHVPPPPHADGRKILLLLKVDNRVLPDSTSEISPLMFNLTGPDGESLDFAKRRTQTSRTVTRVKTPILVNTVDAVDKNIAAKN